MAPAQQPSDIGLPPGVHPQDSTTADDMSVAADMPQQLWAAGRKPFDISNDKALAVFQRAASDWSARLISVTTNFPFVQAVGRRPGRVSVTFSVPSKLADGTTPAAGVLLASDDGELSQAFNVGTGSVYVLNVGDSVTIESEASVHVGLIKGQTQGWVQVVDLWNPPGGGLGST